MLELKAPCCPEHFLTRVQEKIRRVILSPNSRVWANIIDLLLVSSLCTITVVLTLQVAFCLFAPETSMSGSKISAWFVSSAASAPGTVRLVSPLDNLIGIRVQCVDAAQGNLGVLNVVFAVPALEKMWMRYED